MEFRSDLDAELPLGFDGADLMFQNSDFFDSIFSLEEERSADEANCDASTYSDSGLSSDQHDAELSEGMLIEDDLLSSILADQAVAVEEVVPQAVVPKVEPSLMNIVKPKQIIRVQPIKAEPHHPHPHPRSVFLPLHIKDLKTIKIINPVGGLKAAKPKKAKVVSFTTRPASPSLSEEEPPRIEEEDEEEDEEELSGQYPPLQLTEEERRLLSKDGITLPCRYPLTKQEERELKRIRRKIRNKISAQDSRKRKKEYVEGLEERVKQCSEENRSLLKRIKLLQSQNSRLSTQLSRLQSLVFSSGTSKAHPATCFLIVLFSVMLVTLPNIRNLSEDKQLNSLQQFVARRALLFSKQAAEDTVNMDDLITFHSKNADEDVYSSDVEAVLDDLSNKSLEKSKYDEDYIGYDYDQSSFRAAAESPTNEASYKRKFDAYDQTLDDNGGDHVDANTNGYGKRLKMGVGYIEPDIDDVWPPPDKKIVIDNSNYTYDI